MIGIEAVIGLQTWWYTFFDTVKRQGAVEKIPDFETEV